MAQLSHELHTRQQTSLTPRLQQSVKLLQMSTLDFNRKIAEAIETNPFLDERDDAAASQPSPAPEPSLPPEAADGQSLASSHDSDVANGEVAGAMDASAPVMQRIEADKTESSTWSGDYPVARNTGLSDTDISQWAHQEIGLREDLQADLRSYPLNPRDRGLVEYIIDAIDEDGYLRISFADLADPNEFTPPIEDTEWEAALHLVQQAGRPGLAARTLNECLTLQLNALPAATPGKEIALKIVACALEKLGPSDYAGIARLLDCSESQAREAGALIRTLDPRPSGRFATTEPTCYIVPDVIVRRTGTTWTTVSNDDAVPRAYLNNMYAQLFRQSRGNERSLMTQALQEARWLMRSLEQRSTTIQRVAQAIVERQQTFFDYGEIALRPLMLCEIAEELGMHESTVSRATSNKYLASPRGIFELKHFFSRELATKSGGTCSAGSVRALIQEMIVAEDPQEPLSDVRLAQKLAKEGIVVARRTVSKYRAQIKYPPAELRRAP